jgi:hypothetical protein
MENPQNLSPLLVVFVFLSLILCVWAIVDIVRSKFTKLNKVIWLLVVLFAPFGAYIYLFIGRRLKPVKGESVPDRAPGNEVQGPKESQGSSPYRKIAWPFFSILAVMALLCVVMYVNTLSLLGREKTGWVLISGMVIVVLIMTLLQLKRGRKG